MDISSDDYDKLVKAMEKELTDNETRNHSIRVYGRKKIT
jgi:hypothetical protein